MFFYSYGLLCGQNSQSGGLSHTEEVSRTNELQVEAVIPGIVWLCVGEDVTSNSEVRQPTDLWPLRKEGAHLAVTKSV